MPNVIIHCIVPLDKHQRLDISKSVNKRWQNKPFSWSKYPNKVSSVSFHSSYRPTAVFTPLINRPNCDDDSITAASQDTLQPAVASDRTRHLTAAAALVPCHPSCWFKSLTRPEIRTNECGTLIRHLTGRQTHLQRGGGWPTIICSESSLSR